MRFSAALVAAALVLSGCAAAKQPPAAPPPLHVYALSGDQVGVYDLQGHLERLHRGGGLEIEVPVRRRDAEDGRPRPNVRLGDVLAELANDVHRDGTVRLNATTTDA